MTGGVVFVKTWTPEIFSKLKKYYGERAHWILDAWVNVWLSYEFSDWNLVNELKSI